MIISCFTLVYTVVFFFSTAACLGKTVLQTPDNLIKNQDESAVIICTHNIPSYYRILWYKQSPDMLGFKLMGYLNYDKENKEPEFEKKIKLDGDGQKNGTLIINNLMLNDSAVYFCASVLRSYIIAGMIMRSHPVLPTKMFIITDHDLTHPAST
uniref:Ig-like domain-containing protein n=1 Tax=Sinocyclocheilus rhinocerous TaxID=307959 RepID=A0A673LXT3_9TELE